MKIGFSQRHISPPMGLELGGYALYRPCAGIHDPLCCKVLVLEQAGCRYALLSLDLVSVDEALYHRIADGAAPLGFSREHILACAIHTHSAPWGNYPGEGPLEAVNREWMPQSAAFRAYMDQVVAASVEALQCAVSRLERFQVRTARTKAPPVGSNRHDGSEPGGPLTALEFRTDSGRSLVVYSFGCHPTVLNGQNLMASADFTAGVQELLKADQAMFLNGAAGDISTRFTRRESSFAECGRMAEITADCVRCALAQAEFREPEGLSWLHSTVVLNPRPVVAEAEARKLLEQATQAAEAAEAAGAPAGECRILRSYVEGAQVNLQMARTMAGIPVLNLPVTVLRLCGLVFAAVPGELFSSLLPDSPFTVIGYANGYYRYLPSRDAYDNGCYEALAALIDRGEGERLMEMITQLLAQLG